MRRLSLFAIFLALGGAMGMIAADRSWATDPPPAAAPKNDINPFGDLDSAKSEKPLWRLRQGSRPTNGRCPNFGRGRTVPNCHPRRRAPPVKPHMRSAVPARWLRSSRRQLIES